MNSEQITKNDEFISVENPETSEQKIDQEKVLFKGKLQTTEEKTHKGRFYPKEIVSSEIKKLEEINKDITKIEQKLQAIPGAENLDNAKYNRKQRRQIQRKMVHQEKEKQKQMEQKGNTAVTRREFVGLFQSMQKLRDRMYYIDVLTASMEKLLIEKNILTEDELKDTIKGEAEKALAFQDIQKGQKDYENRLKKCLELNINPNISNISQQLYEDADLALAEKIRIAKEYNLEDLIKIFDGEPIKETEAQQTDLEKTV